MLLSDCLTEIQNHVRDVAITLEPLIPRHIPKGAFA